METISQETTNLSLTNGEQNNSSITQGTDGSIVERNINGKIVTVNRYKHYAFIQRSDGKQQQDIFAREASITGETQLPKFLVFDKCTFDIKKTIRGLEAINIKIEGRTITGIRKLKKIPKKKPEQLKTTDAALLFQTTIIQLFREATKKSN